MAVYSGACAGAQRDYAPPVLAEYDRLTFVVNADGTYHQTKERSQRILTAKGAEDYGSHEISYIPGREEIVALQAWTDIPDGTRLTVQPSAIRDREEDNSGGVASFSDTRFKTVIFPRVTPGSLLSYRVESRVVAPSYPGEFSLSFAFPPGFAYRDWEARIILPESRKLHIDLRGVTGGLERTVDGQSHYVFRYRRDTVLAPVPDAVGLIHHADHLFVSTLPDMRSLGRIARTFFEPKVTADDDIRALAQRLVADAASEREKVRAIYNWVTQNIRYVSVALDDGRLVPHPAPQVLRNRYGDCKDHVVLLESLLSAAGIASSPAMINAGKSHLFSPIGIHYPINHVITYVPSLDLYLDSTDPFAPFGTLPLAVSDKPVVLTALDRLGHTPKMNAEEHVNRTKVSMTIRPDGTIDGTSYTRMTGHFEIASRSERFSDLSRPQDEVVKELLFRFNETGTGQMSFAEPTDITRPWRIRAKFTLEPVVNMPGRGGMPIPVGLAPGVIAWAASDTPEPESVVPIRCKSRLVEERYVLRFPGSVTIEAIPRGTRFSKGDVRYESRFQQAGQTVTVQRRLLVQRPSGVCGKEQNRDWRAFYKVLQRDLRSQIVYR